MKLVACADLHGRLPDVPACDLLLVAGDVCPHAGGGAPVGGRADLSHQAEWLGGPFRDWLDRVPARAVVATWGNHDFVGQRAPGRVPAGLRWTLLVDAAATVLGVTVYGCPWSLHFHDWAFNAPPPDPAGEAFLAAQLAGVPAGTDVLLTHGPPLGHGDRTADGRRVGSAAVVECAGRVGLPLVVTGHIHEAYGRTELVTPAGVTAVLNASVVDRQYRLANRPIEFDLDRGG